MKKKYNFTADVNKKIVVNQIMCIKPSYIQRKKTKIKSEIIRLKYIVLPLNFDTLYSVYMYLDIYVDFIHYCTVQKGRY